MARRTGAVPVALTRHSRKAAALKRAGAEHVIATEEQDIVKEVSRLTGGKGARVIFDAVGGPGFARLIASAAIDGIVLVYGYSAKKSMPAAASRTGNFPLLGELLRSDGRRCIGPAEAGRIRLLRLLSE